MSDCRHKHLVLLRGDSAPRLRCRVCHLTIKAADLEDEFCPECYERDGRRHRDFEKVDGPASPARYRCEDCGVLINPHSAQNSF